MLLSIAVILLIAAVAYYHYLQGLFSATLSALIAVFAAVLAIGWHEALTDALLGGKFAAQANAITLVSLFAIIYLVLRIVFDWLIPGNVQFPFLMDKIGAPVMGVIAGMAATGVCAIAAQSLPLGPSIAGYARYDVLKPKSIGIQLSATSSQKVDRELKSIGLAKFWNDQPNKLAIAVDDMFVGLTKKLSGPSGSLRRMDDGDPTTYAQSFAAIHPDYLRELFGQRLGIETGARRDILADQVSLPSAGGVFRLPPKFEAIDHEAGHVRQEDPAPLKLDDFKEPWMDSAEGGPAYVVVRVKFKKEANNSATDEDKPLVRISTGSVRLVMPGPDGAFRDLYPIGTMAGDRVMLSAPDDPLFIDLADADKTADFVFQINPADFKKDEEGSPASRRTRLPFNSFIELKRFARIDLSGKEVQSYSPGSDNGVMRHGTATATLSSGAKVVGKWRAELGKPGDDVHVVMRMDIRDGGALTLSNRTEVRPRGGSPKTTYNVAEGRWSIQGETVTCQLEKGDDGRPVPMKPQQFRVTAGQLSGIGEAPTFVADTSTEDTTAQPANTTGFKFDSSLAGPQQFGKIMTKTPERDTVATVPGGYLNLRNRQVEVARLDGTSSARELRTQLNPVTDLYLPSDKRAFSVSLVPEKGDWDWLKNPDSFILSAGGRNLTPRGVRVLSDGTDENARVYFQYDFSGDLRDLKPGPGKPALIQLIYFVDPGVKIESISYNGQLIHKLDAQP